MRLLFRLGKLVLRNGRAVRSDCPDCCGPVRYVRAVDCCNALEGIWIRVDARCEDGGLPVYRPNERVTVLYPVNNHCYTTDIDEPIRSRDEIELEFPGEIIVDYTVFACLTCEDDRCRDCPDCCTTDLEWQCAPAGRCVECGRSWTYTVTSTATYEVWTGGQYSTQALAGSQPPWYPEPDCSFYGSDTRFYLGWIWTCQPYRAVYERVEHRLTIRYICYDDEKVVWTCAAHTERQYEGRAIRYYDGESGWRGTPHTCPSDPDEFVLYPINEVWDGCGTAPSPLPLPSGGWGDYVIPGYCGRHLFAPWFLDGYRRAGNLCGDSIRQVNEVPPDPNLCIYPGSTSTYTVESVHDAHNPFGGIDTYAERYESVSAGTLTDWWTVDGRIEWSNVADALCAPHTGCPDPPDPVREEQSRRALRALFSAIAEEAGKPDASVKPSKRCKSCSRKRAK